MAFPLYLHGFCDGTGVVAYSVVWRSLNRIPASSSSLKRSNVCPGRIQYFHDFDGSKASRITTVLSIPLFQLHLWRTDFVLKVRLLRRAEPQHQACQIGFSGQGSKTSSVSIEVFEVVKYCRLSEKKSKMRGRVSSYIYMWEWDYAPIPPIASLLIPLNYVHVDKNLEAQHELESRNSDRNTAFLNRFMTMRVWYEQDSYVHHLLNFVAGSFTSTSEPVSSGDTAQTWTSRSVAWFQ